MATTTASRGSRRAAPKSAGSKSRGGRPVKWTIERRVAIVQRVCETIANGGTLFEVCPRNPGPDASVPKAGTFLEWLLKDAPRGDEFAALYARAREARLTLLEEQLVSASFTGRNDFMLNSQGSIAPDQEAIARSKLMADTTKFMLTKLDRKRFGDALDLTSDGKPLGVVAMPGVVELGAPLDAADAKPGKAKRGRRAS